MALNLNNKKGQTIASFQLNNIISRLVFIYQESYWKSFRVFSPSNKGQEMHVSKPCKVLHALGYDIQSTRLRKAFMFTGLLRRCMPASNLFFAWKNIKHQSR
jgi:hypothetical protein